MKIYLYCPPKVATGGTELLHQYCKSIRELGVDAYVWYRGAAGDGLTPDDFLEYGCPTCTDYEVSKDAVVLLPEIFAGLAPTFKRVCICWESVDNYVSRFGNEAPKDPGLIHIWQSYYSYEFLKPQVDPDNLIRVTDYINKAYTEELHDRFTPRADVVLYNPVKGYEITEQIIRRCQGIKFIPIKGMRRAEIVDLMKHSKLYIDFGNHPGKDRLPREAAACGMNIITGRRGGAKNQMDIRIPEIYKMDTDDMDGIAWMVRKSLENYERYFNDYEAYRTVIRNEKELCDAHIERMLNEIQYHYPGI